MESKKPRSGDPIENHKKEVWWRILLPVLFISILALGFLLFLVLNHPTSVRSTSTWSQIAVVWLILPALFAGILLFLLLLVLIRALQKLHKWLPPQFNSARKIFTALEVTSLRVSEKATSPLIGIRSQMRGFKALFHMIKLRK